jgi:hypothetical protein
LVWRGGSGGSAVSGHGLAACSRTYNGGGGRHDCPNSAGCRNHHHPGGAEHYEQYLFVLDFLDSTFGDDNVVVVKQHYYHEHYDHDYDDLAGRGDYHGALDKLVHNELVHNEHARGPVEYRHHRRYRSLVNRPGPVHGPQHYADHGGARPPVQWSHNHANHRTNYCANPDEPAAAGNDHRARDHPGPQRDNLFHLDDNSSGDGPNDHRSRPGCLDNGRDAEANKSTHNRRRR